MLWLDKAPDGVHSIFHELLPLMVDALYPGEGHLEVSKAYRVTNQKLRFQCSMDTGNQLRQQEGRHHFQSRNACTMNQKSWSLGSNTLDTDVVCLTLKP